MAKVYPRFFIYRADANGVLAFAILAAPQIAPVALASFGIFHLVNINASTVNAPGMISPTLPLKELNGGKFVAAHQRHIRNRLGVFYVRLECVSHSCVKYKIKSICCQAQNTIKCKKESGRPWARLATSDRPARTSTGMSRLLGQESVIVASPCCYGPRSGRYLNERRRLSN